MKNIRIKIAIHIITLLVLAFTLGSGYADISGDGPVAGQDWTSPSTGMEFVEVEPGTFKMGSNDGDDDEEPVHDVRIPHRFWMGTYEVTLAEYREFMKASDDEDGIDWDDSDCPYKKDNGYPLSGNKFGQDNAQPVVEVSWHGAVAFCEWLTERERRAGRLPEGYEYRLPTEAEWEYAARGGHNSRGYKYSGSNNADDVAWYDDNSDGKTHEMGQKQPNELGLHDMSGNVFEWCYDWYDSGYYGKSPETNPVNTAAGSYRVCRGGGWDHAASRCRVAYRGIWFPSNTYSYLGFRVVLAPAVQ